MTTSPSQSVPDEEEGASLISILDELTEIVTHSRAMPMSASVMVNKAEVLDLLDAARAVVPGEIHTADGIVADAEAVEERARQRAAEMVAEAERRVERIVSRENVVVLAEERAAQIVADAEAHAAKLAADADDYCDRQLAQFEIDLGAVATQVRAGREALAARAGREAPEDPHAGPTPGRRADREAGRRQGPSRTEDAVDVGTE